MEDTNQPAKLDLRIDFMKQVIESAERRRDAVENKASILIASNAILLTALAGFFNAGPIRPAGDLTHLLSLVFTLGTLAAVVVSILAAVNILASISKEKHRQKVMDIAAEENLFFFGKIALRSKDEYRQAIHALTEEQILDQYVSEAHNVSRLVKQRYNLLYFANRAFVAGVVIFVLMALNKLLGY